MEKNGGCSLGLINGMEDFRLLGNLICNASSFQREIQMKEISRKGNF